MFGEGHLEGPKQLVWTPSGKSMPIKSDLYQAATSRFSNACFIYSENYKEPAYHDPSK